MIGQPGGTRKNSTASQCDGCVGNGAQVLVSFIIAYQDVGTSRSDVHCVLQLIIVGLHGLQRKQGVAQSRIRDDARKIGATSSFFQPPDLQLFQWSSMNELFAPNGC